MNKAVLVALLLLPALALADPVADLDSKEDPQLVLLNASPKLGDRAKIDRLRRVLDARGFLFKLPERMEATLDGRNFLIADVDAIKEAYNRLDFTAALDIVQADEARILQGVAGGDPIPALAQLSEWRGLIAAGMEDPEEAVRWFRAAARFNPAWEPMKPGPSVRKLIKKSRKETPEQGRLRVEADPAEAMIQINGGKAQPASEKISLSTGVHLVVISAEGRKTYAELVDIRAGKTEKLAIVLDPERKSDRAAKLVDAAVAAPPGKARLKKTKALSDMTGGATRFLVIEEGTEDKLTIRVYDLETKKVSKPLGIDSTASSAAIARKVLAALEPDNMLEPTSVMLIEKQRSQRWYERWYVWVGIGAVIGGGVIGYQYMSRDPSAVRGFQ
ncbi:MAG: PEGA domain-containing protein [Kofleriaceae bacterium]